MEFLEKQVQMAVDICEKIGVGAVNEGWLEIQGRDMTNLERAAYRMGIETAIFMTMSAEENRKEFHNVARNK